MTQGTYIGQAQINTQVEHEGYAVGDLVVWKSAQDKDETTRYLVEGFDGDRVILRNLADAWSPIAEWFVKVDENERQHDEVVDVPAQIVGSNVSESLDDVTTNVAIQADEQPTDTDSAANDHERSDTVTITISREDAESWASDDDHIHATAWGPVDKAIRAALEGER